MAPFSAPALCCTVWLELSGYSCLVRAVWLDLCNESCVVRAVWLGLFWARRAVSCKPRLHLTPDPAFALAPNPSSPWSKHKGWLQTSTLVIHSGVSLLAPAP